MPVNRLDFHREIELPGDPLAYDFCLFNNFINLAKDQVRFIGASAGLTDEYMNPESGYLELIGEWT